MTDMSHAESMEQANQVIDDLPRVLRTTAAALPEFALRFDAPCALVAARRLEFVTAAGERHVREQQRADVLQTALGVARDQMERRACWAGLLAWYLVASNVMWAVCFWMWAS